MLNLQLNGVVKNAISLSVLLVIKYVVLRIYGLAFDLRPSRVQIDYWLPLKWFLLGFIPVHFLESFFLSLLFKFLLFYFHVDLLELEVLDTGLLLG